jgi:hypothetical protein
MAVNIVLKPTAAAMGLASASLFPILAHAQEAENPLVLTFEGAVGIGNHSNSYGQEKLGSGFDEFDDDVAYVGSVGLSRAIRSDWDWSLSASQLAYTDNIISEGDDSIAGSFSSGSSRSEVSFTIGHNVDLGDAKVRLGLGLAYAKASAEKGLDLFDGGSGFSNNIETEFQGVGPRASLDVQTAPISTNGKLSVIGGLEVNLLSGKYNHSKGFEAYDGIDSSGLIKTAATQDGEMLTAGVKLGLQLDLDQNTSIRAGVRHDITRMDRAALSGPLSLRPVTVEDNRTSFFVGVKVGF